MNNTIQSLSRAKTLLLLPLFVLGANYAFGQEEEINKSRRLIDIDRASEAIAPMQEAIKKYPEEADLYYYLGYAQIKNDQFDAAAQSFDAGIKLNPKEAINYAGKGHLSMLQNRPQDAKVNLDKALDMTRSKKVPVLKAVAEAYLTHAKFAGDAIALLLKAKSINNRDAETELLLGDAYLLQNQAGSAVSAYENAASFEPTNGQPHYKIGKIFSRSNPPVSLAAYEKAVAVDPEFTLAYKVLGEIYYRRSEADKAAAAYKKYIDLSGDSDENRLIMAFIYLMQKEFAKANEVFKGEIKKDNVNPTVYRYYGRSLQETKNHADSLEAKKVYETFFAKGKPEEIEAGDYLAYSKLLIAMDEDALAIAGLDKALQTDPKFVEAAQLKAETLFKNRNYAEAIGAYKQLFDIKPKPSPNEILNLARSYTGVEKYMEADTVYSKLLEAYPTNIAVTSLAAGVKANIDSTSEKGLAKPLYEKVLELTAAAPDQNKRDVLVASKYLGAYYLLIQVDVPKAKGYWEKALAIDPKDAQALEALKAIKNGSIK